MDSNQVAWGLWTDYDRHWGFRTQLFTTQYGANVITNTLNTLVTIVCIRLFRIILKLLANGNIYRGPTAPMETLAWHILRNGPGRRSIWKHLQVIGWAIVMVLLYLGVIALAVWSTPLLDTGSLAISKSPDCGLYFPNSTASLDILSISRAYETTAQAESAALAETCLNSTAPNCGSFSNPSFNVKVENTTCPFPDVMCFGDGTSSLSMSTGPVQARKLGIRSSHPIEFIRSAVCSPLNTNRTFISLVQQVNDTWTFGYFYGESQVFGSHSYETIRRSDRGDLPTYEVAALWSDGITPDNPWLPIAELTPPRGFQTTMIIIVPQKINYLAPSSDPMFLANETITVDGLPGIYYANFVGPGAVMACLESTAWRDTSIDSNWRPLGQLPTRAMENRTDAKPLYMMMNSLAGSSIFSSINLRLSAALDAQSKITDFVSLPLAAEQWKVEVQRLFNMSLARIMINARDIAYGTKGRYDGFVKWQKPKNDPDICDGTYLIQMPSGQNINFTGLVWVSAIGLAVIILAIPYENAAGQEMLVLEAVGSGLVLLVQFLGRTFRKIWSGVMVSWRWLRGNICTC